MDTLPLVVRGGILLFSLSCSALFSALEASFLTLCHASFEMGRKDERLRTLLHEPENTLAAVLLFMRASQASALVMFMSLFHLLLPHFYWFAPVAVLCILGGGEYLPKLFVLRYKEDLALPLAPLLDCLTALGTPVYRWWSRVLQVILAYGAAAGEEGRGGREPPRLQAERKRLSQIRREEMLYNVLEFVHTRVGEVMTPRTEIFALAAEEPVVEVLPQIREHIFSRIPVYEGAIDHIIGVLYAKDLLAYHRSPPTADVRIRCLLHPPFFVPESKKVDELLQEFQRNKIHLAIVVDEYGGVAGLVTMEDVLEELVGEIIDEYDQEERLVQLVSDQEGYLVSARLPLSDFNHLMSTSLPEEDFETIGGYVLHRFGHVPQVGESVRDGDLLFTIEAVEGSKILDIRVCRKES